MNAPSFNVALYADQLADPRLTDTPTSFDGLRQVLCGTDSRVWAYVSAEDAREIGRAWLQVSQAIDAAAEPSDVMELLG